jgi:23S rRNA pseudouridine1911/1915/1917 synthase
MMGGVLRLTVGDDGAGQRLDRFIAGHVPGLSRSRVVQLLEAGAVQVNGAAPRKSDRTTPGDRIDVAVPPPEPTDITPEPIPLDVLYEDRDLLVLDKPAGMVVHPAPGHRSGTLVNALLHHVHDLAGIGGVLRPGIVHRLDKDTSGLLIVAKREESHRRLSSALKRREIRRTYLAASWGHLGGETLTVRAPIGRSRGDRRRMAVVEGGRSATTHFRRVERWLAADLLHAELETGRTHQIRVHLSSIGHPVVGDATYGRAAARGMSGRFRAWAQEMDRRVPRQFLHAATLRFRHPTTGEMLAFEAPLPADLEAVVDWARSSSSPAERRPDS